MITDTHHANQVLESLRRKGSDIEVAALQLMAHAADLQRGAGDEKLSKGLNVEATRAKNPTFFEELTEWKFVEKPGVSTKPAARVYRVNDLDIPPECKGVILALTRDETGLDHRLSDLGRRVYELKLAANGISLARFAGHQTATHVVHYEGGGDSRDAWIRLVRITKKDAS